MSISKTVKKLGLWLFSLTMLGCNVTADEKPQAAQSVQAEHMATLQWVKSANAKVDAAKAIEKKDYRLFVVATRGQRLLGVDPQQAEAMKKRCGTQYLQGSTDVLRSEEHGVLLQQALDYGTDYNRLVAKHCP